jgi:hypothetical protein
VGGRLSLFVGYPRCRSVIEGKEKASKTENATGSFGLAFNLNNPPRSS